MTPDEKQTLDRMFCVLEVYYQLLLRTRDYLHAKATDEEESQLLADIVKCLPKEDIQGRFMKPSEELQTQPNELKLEPLKEK